VPSTHQPIISSTLHFFKHKVNAMTLDHVMAEAASQKGLVLVLVSNKEEPPAMLKQLALTLQGAASVCFFPDPDQQTLTKFQVARGWWYGAVEKVGGGERGRE